VIPTCAAKAGIAASQPKFTPGQKTLEDQFVFATPFALAAAAERDRDERVAGRVEFARPDAGRAQCTVPARFDKRSVSRRRPVGVVK
jgi:hypothetical protein